MRNPEERLLWTERELDKAKETEIKLSEGIGKAYDEMYELDMENAQLKESLKQLREKIEAMLREAKQDLDNARWVKDSRPIYTHIQVCKYKVNTLEDVLRLFDKLEEKK